MVSSVSFTKGTTEKENKKIYIFDVFHEQPPSITIEAFLEQGLLRVHCRSFIENKKLGVLLLETENKSHWNNDLILIYITLPVT